MTLNLPQTPPIVRIDPFTTRDGTQTYWHVAVSKDWTVEGTDLGSTLNRDEALHEARRIARQLGGLEIHDSVTKRLTVGHGGEVLWVDVPYPYDAKRDGPRWIICDANNRFHPHQADCRNPRTIP